MEDNKREKKVKEEEKIILQIIFIYDSSSKEMPDAIVDVVLFSLNKKISIFKVLKEIKKREIAIVNKNILNFIRLDWIAFYGIHRIRIGRGIIYLK
jgi:hypothetical protein